jgi:hypothetical protein
MRLVSVEQMQLNQDGVQANTAMSLILVSDVPISFS